MKKKLKTLLLASVLGVMAFGLAGCGQGKVSQEQKEAVEYYENLGIGKEDAEDLAEAIVGNGSANNNASEENIDNAAESSLPVVDIMPEIANGTMNDYYAQYYDMLFRCDLTMTPEEVKKVIDDSDFDFTYEEEWCSCGTHAVINSISLNDIPVFFFEWMCTSNYEETDKYYLIAQSKQKEGAFLSGVRHYDNMQKNFHVSGEINPYTYFTNRDDILAYAQSLGCVESTQAFGSRGKSDDFDFDYNTESLYYNSQKEMMIYWVDKVYESDERVKSSDGFYMCQGFTMYRSHYLKFEFNPDGTISSISSENARCYTDEKPIFGLRYFGEFEVYGPKID